MQPPINAQGKADTKEAPSLPRRIAISESIPPLLRGIGLTVILLATVIGAIQAETDLKAKRAQQQSQLQQNRGTSDSTSANDAARLDALAREVSQLRETAHEETVVDEVLLNPWFEILGMAGTAIMASSFYTEWLSKRPEATKRNG